MRRVQYSEKYSLAGGLVSSLLGAMFLQQEHSPMVVVESDRGCMTKMEK